MYGQQQVICRTHFTSRSMLPDALEVSQTAWTATSDTCRCRERVTKALKFALEDATSPGRGGVIREALVQGYPRLAGLLDDLFKKLRQDTDVSAAHHQGPEKLAFQHVQFCMQA